MTSGHLIYIPLILMAGMFLGFLLGVRAARNQFDLERRREEERAAVRAERARKKAERAARQAAASPEGGGDAA
jgi:hypothetical protein